MGDEDVLDVGDLFCSLDGGNVKYFLFRLGCSSLQYRENTVQWREKNKQQQTLCNAFNAHESFQKANF